MKSRYKISIIVVVIIVGIYVVLSPTWTVILCDDRILNLDDCGDYLQEKYSKLQMFNHFAGMYPDAWGIGFQSSMFKADNVFASSILADNVFVFLEMNLNDSTFHYVCQNHNFGDNYVVVELENITIKDLDDNNYLILNQLDGDLIRK
jgi:hypothetical protein